MFLAIAGKGQDGGEQHEAADVQFNHTLTHLVETACVVSPSLQLRNPAVYIASVTHVSVVVSLSVQP